jgi:hypothetical protein
MANAILNMLEFSGIIVSHQVFVKPKTGYESLAISMWQNSAIPCGLVLNSSGVILNFKLIYLRYEIQK